MSTSAPPSPVTSPPRPRPRSPRGFGPLLLRLHFYAGLFVAPFLLVAALTGLLYVFSPQIEQAVYADELTVSVPATPPRALAEQVAAARAAHPAGDLLAVRPGAGDTTTQVDFAFSAERQHTVYVNPYTGAVTGQLTTWFATTPLKTWFDDLHRNLHLGAVGRHYSEFAASWLAVITLGGLLLWWRRTRSLRTMVKPDLAARKGVRRTRGWHAATGVWLTLGLLILSATGLTWSRYAGDNFASAVDTLSAGRPSVTTSLTGAPAAGAGHHETTAPAAGAPVDPAVITDVARVAEEQGLTAPLEITVPADATTAWTVTENRTAWPVARDSIAVDATTGTVVDRIDFADWSLLAKLTQWGINAHMGTLFGIANQILLAALAIGLICVIVWGYRMWWQRRPTRDDRRALVGAPPARGAWHQLPPWAVVVGVPLVYGLAWALPLLGIPLAAFLLVDYAIGAVRRRRRPAGPRPEAPVSPAPAGLR